MKRCRTRWINVHGMSIGIVERIEWQTYRGSGYHGFFASLTPIAVLFRDDGKDTAVGLDGQPLDIDFERNECTQP